MINGRPHDVAGEQVGGELNAPEGGVERVRERAHEQRLGQPGQPFQQQMAAGEQADQEPLYGLVLSDYSEMDRVRDPFQEPPAAGVGPGFSLGEHLHREKSRG